MTMSSMLYTMGTALDRAADSGCPVSLLAEGQWIGGQVAAVDSMGVVIETEDGNHAVIRVDRIAAVKVQAESPFRAAIDPSAHDDVARTMPGPRTA